MTLREQYFAEEAQGIKHDVDVDTYIIRKLDEDFVQRYTKDGVPILPASWNDHDDEVWEAYL